MRQGIAAAIVSFAMSSSAFAADVLTKAAVSYDWTGFYAGAQLDYQAGHSRWSENGPGLSNTGAFDLGEGYSFSAGTGSYAIGFQGRYDFMNPSRHVFGVEGDIWFPNSVIGSQTFASPGLGSAGYSETVQF